ncbi:protein LEO1 homolog [Impatiens glandulifera]|uniref:protein LEO1 homolog n=1 Tax=Impatiens glandulifera TaxID=253017 RepID=UPI001FB077E2|nr:protein LEO1 homolog [Impatiens glandulifera]
MVGEEKKRHQMMQNLFGDQSEEEEEEEVESEHESNRQPYYHSDDGDGGVEPEGEGEVEGQGEAEVESEGKLHGTGNDLGESASEAGSQDVEIEDQREDSEGKDSYNNGMKHYHHRGVTSGRLDDVESGSERSHGNHYADNEDEEVEQDGSPRSPGEEKDENQILESVPEIRDVFGDSDNEEPAEYEVPKNLEKKFTRSPMEEEESYGRDLRPEDSVPDEEGALNNQENEFNRSPMEDEGSYGRELEPEDAVPDEEAHYGYEDENIDAKIKDKPVGPPLELEIPFCHPPAHPDKMNIIKVSNIMGIDPKPFDRKTYVEEDVFVTDESGSKKRIKLDNNIVRWRVVQKPDGKKSYESNARFVRWSDGSLQLLIGNEVLDISVQDAQHDQAHLFLRHEKGILQSQGRISRKMRFMPSSLTSNSHRLLTALVDSRHKKVYKVKNCITDIDPEREKEQKEKAESQTIRANELLSRKKEKVSRKYSYMPTVRRERKLSPGFLEDALDEDEEPDYYDSRQSSGRRRFDDDPEMEARAEKRIISAKKGSRDLPKKSSTARPSRHTEDLSESEREESEYETDGEEYERSPQGRNIEEPELENEEEEEEEAADYSDDEREERKRKGKEVAGGSHKRKGIESDEESPPKKAATHRRMAIVYDSDDE